MNFENYVNYPFITFSSEDIEEMEESDSDSTKNQDVDMENEESDSDEDTDSSESDDEVDDEFRTALKSALGNAAVEEDKSDEAEEEEVIINENILFL